MKPKLMFQPVDPSQQPSPSKAAQPKDTFLQTQLQIKPWYQLVHNPTDAESDDLSDLDVEVTDYLQQSLKDRNYKESLYTQHLQKTYESIKDRKAMGENKGKVYKVMKRMMSKYQTLGLKEQVMLKNMASMILAAIPAQDLGFLNEIAMSIV